MERHCAYCGDVRCKKHSYRKGRAGIGAVIEAQNITRETTIGEMRKCFEQTMQHFSDDTKAVWRFGFTETGLQSKAQEGE